MGKRRELVVKSAWSSKVSTKHFFQRICTKYGDNVIPTLKHRKQGNARPIHDKADILADSWRTNFNGEASTKEDIEAYVARHKDNWAHEDLSDVDAEITEEEVAEAIRKCKREKACGPDDLTNECYQDHVESLVLILTIVLHTGSSTTEFWGGIHI